MAGIIKRTTANYSFRIPYFDVQGWGREMERNFDTIDAVLFASTNFGGIVGPWLNSTDYVQGQRVVDQADSTVWEAVIDHTSSPTGTFAQERVNFPARWTPITNSFNDKGEWTAATNYVVNDIIQEDYLWALAIRNFESTTSLQDDIDDGNAVTMFDGTDTVADSVAAKVAAEAAQSAAAASQSAAATSATNAGNSATAAAGSATSASGSATTATTQAGIATTQATNAATSATNAANSATSAGTSATNASNSAAAAAISEANAALFDWFTDCVPAWVSNTSVSFSAGIGHFGGKKYTLPALTKLANAVFTAGNNQGMLDTGVLQSNKTYFLFSIRNTTTGIGDYLMSLSLTAPTVPAGWELLSGSRVGIVITNNSTQIFGFEQIGNEVLTNMLTESSQSASFTANSFQPSCSPAGISTDVKLIMACSPSAGATVAVYAIGSSAINPGPASQYAAGTASALTIATTQCVRTRANGTMRLTGNVINAAGSIIVSSVGWNDYQCRRLAA